jgi:hypothetical protein
MEAGTMIEAIEAFDAIGVQAGKVLDETYSLEQAEPLFVEALELVKANPQLRSEFEAEFTKILDDGLAPFEIVEFCMRDLQWPVIREHVVGQLRKSDARRGQVLQRILDVYEPHWENEDLYQYYRPSGQPPP